jgi:hypothetical protein
MLELLVAPIGTFRMDYPPFQPLRITMKTTVGLG